MSFLSRIPRWLSRLPLLLLAVTALLALLLVVGLGLAGLRVQAVSWQDGRLQVAGWQWQRAGCEAISGEQLSLSGLMPIDIRMARLRVPACDVPDDTPLNPADTPQPWTPAFRLAIARVELPALPPLRLRVSQQDQRWQIDSDVLATLPAALQQAASALQVRHDRDSGRWTLSGQVQAGELAEGLLGTLAVTGEGIWLPGQLGGELRVVAHQLGHAGQPQRADARATATLDNRRWELDAVLDAPLALGAGWQLSARKALAADGTLDALQSVALDVEASGPQGRAVLRLNTEAPGLARGRGELRLSGAELAGRLPLQWQAGQLQVGTGTLRLPQAVQLHLQEPLSLPLAASGETQLTLAVQQGRLRAVTRAARLRWQGADWHWQGGIELAGDVAGNRLSGGWQGSASAAGLQGEPLRLALRGPVLVLALQAPVTGLKPPYWRSDITLDGRLGAYPLQAAVSVGQQQSSWQGRARIASRLPQYSQGGALTLDAPWQLRDGALQLNTGGRVALAEGVFGQMLIRPLTATLATPLQIAPDGARGRLQIDAGGLVAARATLPAVTGSATLAGRAGSMALRIPGWQTALDITAQLDRPGGKGGAGGRLTLSSPLTEAMSRGLGVTLKSGQLSGSGQWRWQGRPELDADLRLSGLALDWGGILASGGNGAVRVRVRDQAVSITSTAPITLAELDVGTLVRDIRMDLASDLTLWQMRDVRATVFSGQLAAPLLQWPSEAWQPVTLQGIDLAQLAALQGQPDAPVRLAGLIGGVLPLQIGRTSLALRDGDLRNEGPLSVQLLPTPAIVAMSQSNLAVQLALDSLSNLLVNDFQARLGMSADGWLDAAVTIRGDNLKPNRQPVVLNYTHRENVLELLRSLRIGDEISQRVLDRQKGKGGK